MGFVGLVITTSGLGCQDSARKSDHFKQPALFASSKPIIFKAKFSLKTSKITAKLTLMKPGDYLLWTAQPR